MIRLQKVLASAGLGSRRACEALITAGRVRVDGALVTELGTRVDPQAVVVHVDGQRVNVSPQLRYLVLNKPRGVLCTMSDDRGRPTVADLLAVLRPDESERLFHVGRLDADTEGLLLLTNDGELAHRLMHPGFAVPKTYVATVPGPIPRGLARALRAGVELDDGPVRVDAFRVVNQHEGKAMVELVLHEGRNRIVRRMLEQVGHPVWRLVRTAIGPVHLGAQRQATVRELTRTELAALYRLTDEPAC
jgi:23S rRNA pseudouridine2605 synthase